MSSRRQRTVATAILAVALIGAGGAVATGARSSDGGDGGQPSAPSSSSPSSTPDETVTRPVERSVPVRLDVRRMRLTAPVTSLEAGRDQVMELPPLRKAGWDSTSVTPGENGVAVLAGYIHRGPEPGVFEDLGRLRRGDEVVVRREDSSAVRFRVDRIASYELGTFPADQVYAGSGVPELRLISIGGALEGQPPGNVVVYATALHEHSAE